jgi:hypothetical protein
MTSNMTIYSEPKKKNNLNIRSNDIELAIRIMNNEWQPDLKLESEPKETLYNRLNNNSELQNKSKTNLLGKTFKKINSPTKC